MVIPGTIATSPAQAVAPINQYPDVNESQIQSSATISAATYNSTPNTITYTTSRNVFASYGTGSNASGAMYVLVTGLTSGACTGANTYNTPKQALAITSISASGGIVTYTATAITSLITGENVTITGATTAGYNGTFRVASTSGSTSFTVVSSATGATSTATGSYSVWQQITAATDTTFTIANPSGNVLTACSSITGQTGAAIARASGLLNQVGSRTSLIATDGTGSVIVMSTGAKWPINTTSGYLYISKDSGSTFRKIDFVNSSGVPLSGTTFTHKSSNAALAPFSTLGYTGCQHISCQWNSVSISNDGQVIAAASFGGEFIFSKDGGTSWIEVSREGYNPCLSSEVWVWQDVKVSRDGTKIFAAESGKSLMWFLDLSKPITQISSGGRGSSYGLPYISTSTSGNTVVNAATDTYDFSTAVNNHYTLTPSTNGDIVDAAMYPSNQSLDLNPGAGSATCNQSIYSSQTNPSVISPYSADTSYLSVVGSGRVFTTSAGAYITNNPYAIGISGTGTNLYIDGGFQTFKRCVMNGPWSTSTCQVQTTVPGTTDPNNANNPYNWSNIDVRSIFASASGKYVTVVGFQNEILVSTNYGVSWTNNASSPYSTAAAATYSPTCQNPYGVVAIAGSDDGRCRA